MSALRTAAVSLICLEFSLGSATAQGAEAGLFVAGMNFRLGMSRQAVLDSLAGPAFQVTKMGGVDSWIIYAKTPASTWEDAGAVGFRGGKLVWISRLWGSFPQADAVRLANELYRALGHVSESAKVPVVVTVKPPADEPGIHVSQIQFEAGLRKVTVLITEGSPDKGGNQVTIQEDVGGP